MDLESLSEIRRLICAEYSYRKKALRDTQERFTQWDRENPGSIASDNPWYDLLETDKEYYLCIKHAKEQFDEKLWL